MQSSAIHFLAKIIIGIFALVLLSGCSPTEDIRENDPSNVTQAILTSLLTEADYQRAESFLQQNTSTLMQNSILAQYWQDNGQLVYRRSALDGSDYILYDPVTESKSVLIDNNRLAVSLGQILGADIEPLELVLTRIQLYDELGSIFFRYQGDNYFLDRSNYEIKLMEDTPSSEFLSPDRSKTVFIEDHNLWMRNTASNELTQLTVDGVEDYGYGTNNAGWIRGSTPVIRWSPDSSKIASFRHDGRNVGEMYLFSTKVGHPELEAWKYPLPGDEHIFMIERIVIHLEDEVSDESIPRIVRLNMSPDAHRSTTSDHIAGNDGGSLDVQWSEDSKKLAFVSSSRDHKVAQLRIADIETGAVRDVYREEAATQYESGIRAENWRVFHERGEFIWYSEKDNWGHLYLHDLETGELKRQLTSGSWLVLSLSDVDLEKEQLFFFAAAKEGGDPYFQYLYRIALDGSGLKLLTPEIANHSISWSQSSEFFTDTYSTPIQAPISVLKDRSGAQLAIIEETDISQLQESGWVAPIPFVVKARDQLTDLYGLMYRPMNFDEEKSYPVLNYLYPGPSGSSVGSRSFQSSRRDNQAVAELGFIVVEVDAMGTPGRSKSFHDIYYGNMADNGLPDQVGTIQQLASSRPWMDLDRVGIWGHSGGGFASTAGILRYPDFYKVAVSSAGNHDNRNYEDDWGERWQGLLETYPESTPLDTEFEGGAVSPTNYDSQANQLLVKNLQGKLLLAHGLMDTNVHPSNTLLVVEALIEAEKEFDLLILPNLSHDFSLSRYFMLKRWNYFVEHLLHINPVADFRFAENIP